MKFALYFQHIWHELFIYLQSFVISDFPLNPWDAVCFEEGNADVQIELKSLLLNPLLLTFPELCSLVHFSPVQSCAPHPCKPIRSNSCQAWDLDRTSIRASLSCVPATIPLCCCQPTPPVYCYLSFNQLSSWFFFVFNLLKQFLPIVLGARFTVFCWQHNVPSARHESCFQAVPLPRVSSKIQSKPSEQFWHIPWKCYDQPCLIWLKETKKRHTKVIYKPAIEDWQISNPWTFISWMWWRKEQSLSWAIKMEMSKHHTNVMNSISISMIHPNLCMAQKNNRNSSGATLEIPLIEQYLHSTSMCISKVKRDCASQMKEEFMMCGSLSYSPWLFALLAGAK